MKKKYIRNRKGNVLLLEFVSLIPMFFLLMVLMFDFMNLYTGTINMQQAAQAAMSEIAFMGKEGEEIKVVPNAVRKANAIISYAVTEGTDPLSPTAHAPYTYRLINQQLNTSEELNHFMVEYSGFLKPGTEEYLDHNHEIWGFSIEREFEFEHVSLPFLSFSVDIKAVQYMGILKGVKNN